MDESWRCTMGSVLPRQRASDHHAGGGGGGRQSLAPDDFRDVFGGPPRTVLLRSFYGAGEAENYHSPAMGQQHQHHVFYGGADAFGRRYGAAADGRGAAAAVPTEEGFFDDIFGAGGRHVRSRSRSTKSSSVVSSDEFGAGPAFCRQPAGSGCRGGDATLSSFASKLRPIAIPSRRYDSSPPSTASTRGDYQSSFTCSTAAYPASRCYYAGRTTATNHSSAASSNAESSAPAAHHGNHRHHHRGSGGFCCFTSNPETTSNGHSFRRTRRGGRARSPAAAAAADADTATEWSHSHAADYGYYYSPPSATSSSAFGNQLPRTPRRLEEVVMEVRERAPLLMDDDGDIDSVGAAAVDEAIAWAKERFWSQA
ncbi:uncharacterized protein LOC102710886 [Oryza brachyantha]|uniref:uncharacterized protein LOC102710886 n=1 Tax=Oryza brachyantha TaxID=4533 RepID=UPI001AD9BD18|nr:uncharacterized protein LOC102710886 [Oryza brachyantha]